MTATALEQMVRSRRAVALTGAGLSTESGIPDYRGATSRLRPRTPLQHRDFLRDPAVRRRYWARSFVGWPRISRAQPNAGHEAVAELERLGIVSGVITQNVDRLHRAAGSRRVIELHGALAETRCLSCGLIESREDLQARMVRMNPAIDVTRAMAAPDGDADLDAAVVQGFNVPSCTSCDGVLKPDVVFFGDNVPRPVVDEAFAMVDAAEVLLVLGTSLAVFSGYRFVRRAAERDIPIAIVNEGETRGDALATIRIDARLGDVLPRLVQTLMDRPAVGA
ncbi:MAG: NAD-dependent protein deacetylase [Polyangiaceae bacterium]|nr:NAD-dependent protein deacetylase [Polyangiaceae bacterium]